MTEQYHLPLPPSDAAMSLEDFLPSTANEEALRWMVHTPPSGWPSHLMILCGPKGSGKTHLLTIWQQKTGAQKINAGDDVIADILAHQSSAPTFALDDADLCAGDKGQEEWLQHFYNATKTANLPVLITCTRAPTLWGLKTKDIETRLKSCACTLLHEPDEDLTRGLFLKLFHDRQLLVETGVIDYLVPRIERTATAICEAVAALDEASLASGRKISIPFVQKTLNFQQSSSS